MTAPKCEDCRHFVHTGKLPGLCASEDGKYWRASTDRMDGNCGPKGINFEPEKPEWPKALTVGAVRGSVIKPKECKRHDRIGATWPARRRHALRRRAVAMGRLAG